MKTPARSAATRGATRLCCAWSRNRAMSARSSERGGIAVAIMCWAAGSHRWTAWALQAFRRDSTARCALLVDRNGQLVATVGDTPKFDPTAFASLTAADFSANDQLAKMIGEAEFASLVHQGERESMYLADVAKRVILVVLFDQRATLGLVKLKAKAD